MSIFHPSNCYRSSSTGHVFTRSPRFFEQRSHFRSRQKEKLHFNGATSFCRYWQRFRPRRYSSETTIPARLLAAQTAHRLVSALVFHTVSGLCRQIEPDQVLDACRGLQVEFSEEIAAAQ
uniref:Uncharacterized protein n=1 Tax=Caenorhabditis japonica TaxID=281687 RepID=A0A8R1EIZ7_CAEJA